MKSFAIYCLSISILYTRYLLKSAIAQKSVGGKRQKSVGGGWKRDSAKEVVGGGGGVKRNSAKIWRVSDDDLTVMYVHHDI